MLDAAIITYKYIVFIKIIYIFASYHLIFVI